MRTTILMKFELLLACLALAPSLFADVEYSDNVAWSYSIVRDKAYLYGVSSPAPICETNDVLYIPSTLGGKPVVAIERVHADWHTEVVIPASVTSVRCDGDWWASPYSNDVTNRLSRISVASNNAYYKSVDGCLYTKDGRTLVRCPPGRIGKVCVASGTRFIARRAFDSCTYVTEVELPEGVLSIGYRAFYGCSSLNSVNLPTSLRLLDDYAFYGCSQLSGDIAIPDGVQRIGAYAFWQCAKISSVSFPDSLVEIGENAFYICTNITSVSIPASVTYIGSSAFEYCSNLTNIELNEGLEEIAGYAFSNTSCSNLVIPCSVKRVGYSHRMMATFYSLRSWNQKGSIYFKGCPPDGFSTKSIGSGIQVYYPAKYAVQWREVVPTSSAFYGGETE